MAVIVALDVEEFRTDPNSRGQVLARRASHHPLADDPVVRESDPPGFHLDEAPFSEERSLAVIAEANALVPTKPIRYLINTHHHFDHSSGIRTYVAEGVTIVTHRVNTDYFNRVRRLPRTLSPDRLSQNPKPARFEALTDKHVLTDGTRSLELHRLEGNTHNPSLLLVYLPKERLLHQADAFTAPPPGAPLPPANNMVNARNLNLVAHIDRLRPQVDRITAAHGRVMPIADLRKVVGKAN